MRFCLEGSDQDGTANEDIMNVRKDEAAMSVLYSVQPVSSHT